MFALAHTKRETQLVLFATTGMIAVHACTMSKGHACTMTIPHVRSWTYYDHSTCMFYSHSICMYSDDNACIYHGHSTFMCYDQSACMYYEQIACMYYDHSTRMYYDHSTRIYFDHNTCIFYGDSTCMYYDHNTCMYYDLSRCMYYDRSTCMSYDHSTCLCHDHRTSMYYDRSACIMSEMARVLRKLRASWSGGQSRLVKAGQVGSRHVPQPVTQAKNQNCNEEKHGVAKKSRTNLWSGTVTLTRSGYNRVANDLHLEHQFTLHKQTGEPNANPQLASDHQSSKQNQKTSIWLRRYYATQWRISIRGSATRRFTTARQAWEPNIQITHTSIRSSTSTRTRKDRAAHSMPVRMLRATLTAWCSNQTPPYARSSNIKASTSRVFVMTNKYNVQIIANQRRTNETTRAHSYKHKIIWSSSTYDCFETHVLQSFHAPERRFFPSTPDEAGKDFDFEK